MSQDKHSGSDPEGLIREEDAAFLRHSAKPETLGSTARAEGPSSKPFRKRRSWLYLSIVAGLAAGLVLFIKRSPESNEGPGAMQTRGPAGGFAAEIKVHDQTPDIPPGYKHHLQVKVTANSDGYIALFQQQGEGAPVFVANLAYKNDQGEMNMLEEDAASGARYCIVGAKDQEGLKHLVELVPDLWTYLPATSCFTVP